MAKKRTSILVDAQLWGQFDAWRKSRLLSQSDAMEMLMLFATQMSATDEQRIRKTYVQFLHNNS